MARSPDNEHPAPAGWAAVLLAVGVWFVVHASILHAFGLTRGIVSGELDVLVTARALSAGAGLDALTGSIHGYEIGSYLAAVAQAALHGFRLDPLSVSRAFASTVGALNVAGLALLAGRLARPTGRFHPGSAAAAGLLAAVAWPAAHSATLGFSGTTEAHPCGSDRGMIELGGMRKCAPGRSCWVRFGAVAGTVLAVVLSGRSAWATEPLPPDAYLCVGTPSDGSCGPPCTSYHPTFADALVAARTLPDIDGERPAVQVCLVAPGPHVESIVVDNAGGQLGRQLLLSFDGHPLCPDPNSPSEQPVIEFALGPGGLPQGIQRVNIDLTDTGPCLSAPRPGVLFTGDHEGHDGSGFVAGTVGYAYRHEGIGQGVGDDGTLRFFGTRIVQCVGSAIQARPHLSLNQVQVAGCTVGPTSFLDGVVALVSGGHEDMSIHNSVFLANTVRGGHDGKGALVAGWIDRFEGNYVLGNALLGGASALRNGFTERAWEVDHGELVDGTGPFPFEGNVFAENRQLREEPPPPDTSSLMIPRPPPTARECVGDGMDLDTSPGAWMGDIELGRGSLIRLDRSIGLPWDGEGFYVRSMFLRNELGGGPIFEVTAPVSGTWLELVQNTFADNPGSPVLSWKHSLPDGGIVVARNLYLGDGPPETALLDVAGFPGSLIVTGNGSDITQWVNADIEAEWRLLGPNVEGLEPDFLAATWNDGLTPCERAAVLSPSVAQADCEDAARIRDALHCAAGPAASYVLPRNGLPTSHAWPWRAPFFHPGTLGPLGATGWDQADVRASVDVVVDAPGWGDNDGYPNIVDCDNDDPSVVPFIPEYDGVSSEYCIEPEGSCYRCPDGVHLPPSPDDDDSGAAVEDDDDSVPSPRPPPVVGEEPGGCSKGCGFSWGSDGLESISAVLLLLPIGLARRPRRGHPPIRR